MQLTYFEEFRKTMDDLCDFDYFSKLKHEEQQKILLLRENFSSDNIIQLMEKVIPKNQQIKLQSIYWKTKQQLNLWDLYVEITSFLFPFFYYQSKTFRIENGLSDLLQRTNLSEIPASFIKLPFESICIMPPEGNLFLDVDIIKEIYVFQANTMDYTNKILSIHFVLDNPLLSGNLFRMIFPYDEEKEIYSQIESQFSNFGDKNQYLVDALSYVLNSILYINSSNIATQWIQVDSQSATIKKKSAYSTVSPKKSSSLSYYHLGKDIVIDSRLQEKVAKVKQIRKRQLRTSQWIVRGHWRNQACGENRSKRRLVWIQPQVRGDKSAPLHNKGYVAK